jgi:hypothetical protein
MSVTRHTSTVTLGADLERLRLRWRAERMTITVAWLRQYASEPVAPRHVRRAISDFEAQIAVIRARLRELGRDDEPVQVERRRRSHDSGH